PLAGNYSFTVTVQQGTRSLFLPGGSASFAAAPLVVAVPASANAVQGTPYSGVVGSFAKGAPWLDLLGDFTATVSWGDSSQSPGVITTPADEGGYVVSSWGSTPPPGGYTVLGQHTYASAGDYTVTLTVVAASGASQSASGTIHVSQPGPA